MSDNVELDSMTGGAIVATDDDGTAQHQYVKMEFGGDGTFTKVAAANPLPVSVINGTVAVNTPGTITSGTVSVNTPGTITSGSISVIAGTVGTVAAVGQVHNAGTIQGGTIQQVTNGSIVVTAGTVAVNTPGTITSGTVSINAGTIGAGTINTMGTLTNLVNGSIRIVAGTTNAGTLDLVTTVSNITNGSIVVTAGTIGTVANVAKVHNAGTIAGGTVQEITNGSIRVVAGTIAVNTPGTITSGSIAVTAGTITSGSIVVTAGTIGTVANVGMVNAGTIKINPRPATNLITIGSIWGTNSGTAGTLIAAVGVGTSILLNELSIINEGTSTLTAGMGFGTNQQGTLVVARAAMGGNGGIEKPFPKALGGSHANLPLVMWTTGSGTASFVVSYWTEAQ